ncbi:PilZ domain-containing protein [Aureimonas flava]|nr:PilZ domain-containing protein [Aureimonas flava]
MVAVSHPASDDNERRVAPRTRILKRGKILFNNRYSTFDCTVRNISATGALLTIDPAVPLPKLFEIRIGEDETVRSAKLVYRRDSFAGIHFIDAAEGAGEAGSTDAPTSAGMDELRIHPRPLPAALVACLSWTRS